MGWGLEVPAVREHMPWLYPQEAHSHALALPSISPGSRDDPPPSDGETEAQRAEWLARGLAARRGNALCLAAFSPLPRVSLPRLTSLSRSAASCPLSSSRARCAAVQMPSLADLAFAAGEALPEAHSLLSAPQALLKDSPFRGRLGLFYMDTAWAPGGWRTPAARPWPSRGLSLPFPCNFQGFSAT